MMSANGPSKWHSALSPSPGPASLPDFTTAKDATVTMVIAAETEPDARKPNPSVVDEAAEGEEESGTVATLRGNESCWDGWCGSASSPSGSSMVVVGIVEDHENVWLLNMQKDISLVVVVGVDLQ